MRHVSGSGSDEKNRLPFQALFIEEIKKTYVKWISF
jgi:hypothetical protein